MSDEISGSAPRGLLPRKWYLLRRVTSDRELSDSALRVAFVLLDHHSAERGCFPSVGRIAEQSGRARRSVQRALDELVGAGYLRRHLGKGGKGRGGYTNSYEPVFDAVEGASPMAHLPDERGVTDGAASPKELPERGVTGGAKGVSRVAHGTLLRNTVGEEGASKTASASVTSLVANSERKARSSPITFETYQPSTKIRAWARGACPLVDVEEQAEAYRLKRGDYQPAESKVKDFDRDFRRWCFNEQKRKKRLGPALTPNAGRLVSANSYRARVIQLGEQAGSSASRDRYNVGGGNG